jgi:putative transposase
MPRTSDWPAERSLSDAVSRDFLNGVFSRAGLLIWQDWPENVAAGRLVLRPLAHSLKCRQALAVMQIDHTLVDIMVVDEVLRQSMGRPWITVAFDIATRVVLGVALPLEPPSATSVGLAMACLPKDQWLKERQLDIEWVPAGLPRTIHCDNGKEFHSLAWTRGCERYGISLEYRPPARPTIGEAWIPGKRAKLIGTRCR